MIFHDYLTVIAENIHQQLLNSFREETVKILHNLVQSTEEKARILGYSAAQLLSVQLKEHKLSPREVELARTTQEQPNFQRENTNAVIEHSATSAHILKLHLLQVSNSLFMTAANQLFSKFQEVNFC